MAGRAKPVVPVHEVIVLVVQGADILDDVASDEDRGLRDRVFTRDHKLGIVELTDVPRRLKSTVPFSSVNRVRPNTIPTSGCCSKKRMAVETAAGSKVSSELSQVRTSPLASDQPLLIVAVWPRFP